MGACTCRQGSVGLRHTFGSVVRHLHLERQLKPERSNARQIVTDSKLFSDTMGCLLSPAIERSGSGRLSSGDNFQQEREEAEGTDAAGMQLAVNG
jgi:hypothetical protein